MAIHWVAFFQKDVKSQQVEAMPASKMVEQDVVRKAGDEYYVFVVSDADLGRYGISPAAWNKILMQDQLGNFGGKMRQPYKICIDFIHCQVAAFHAISIFQNDQNTYQESTCPYQSYQPFLGNWYSGNRFF